MRDRSRRLRRGWPFLAGGLFLAIYLFIQWPGEARLQYGEPNLIDGVVRATLPTGERVAFLTTQWETRLVHQGGGRFSMPWQRQTTAIYIDLWILDAVTAQPLHCLRLRRHDRHPDLSVLGVDHGVLWLRMPELVGVRLDDASVTVDRARILAANPDLADVLPAPQAQERHLAAALRRERFGLAEGLAILLDDGRHVRIDPLTLRTEPAAPPRQAGDWKTADRDTAISDPLRNLPRRVSTRDDTDLRVRGLTLARAGDTARDWLGLVAEHEIATIAEEGYASPTPPYSSVARYRLYRGLQEPVEHFFGTRYRLRLVEPLPEAGTFLQGGLLIENPLQRPPGARWRRNPDSVFVLHRDRLGDEGRWQLARIAGPRGRTVWEIPLPLSQIGLWLPGERHGLLLGPWHGAERHPTAKPGENPIPQIVSVDFERGTHAVFNLDRHRDWPATAAHLP